MSQVLITLTAEDERLLKLNPVSVSRILKEASRLLDGDMADVDADGGVTAEYLLALEPLLNRLFAQAREELSREA